MTINDDGAISAVRQIVHHHALLRRGLERRAGTLCEAVESGVPFERQMTTLREYLAGEVLPHAEAEERTLYQAAATQARGGELVRALTAEHHELAYLAGRLRPGADGREAATAAERMATLFAGHVAKENDLLLPALTGSGADLASLLARMHEPPAGAQASREDATRSPGTRETRRPCPLSHGATACLREVHPALGMSGWARYANSQRLSARHRPEPITGVMGADRGNVHRHRRLAGVKAAEALREHGA